MSGLGISAPVGNRTHIIFLGRMNSGKSSLVNALVGQQVSIVNRTPGTTTDVVKKPMEIHGIGACTILDTAGFDDEGELGSLRTKASKKALDEADLAILLFPEGNVTELERSWLEEVLKRGIPVVGVISMIDRMNEDAVSAARKRIASLNIPAVCISSAAKEGIPELLEQMREAMKGRISKKRLLGGLVENGAFVVLVMPQDPQAPEGRLILPEVQTIREVLDRHCVAVCCAPEEMESVFTRMQGLPDLVITDSQVFGKVYKSLPRGVRLTSFSVLFAALRGDISYYAESAKAIDTLNENSRVLIAEICTHAPMAEDIGREKIPALLRKRAGAGLKVDICAGSDFPENLTDYDLIIQCGGCMFNRSHILARIDRARCAGVPMTNYGIAIAYMNQILDKVIWPE
ncbi:MAG TPA: [FeFe] hydrogenase H-cluster maturation GTPase HydF [Oribacterium sp.]|nr:[FeFe] hydrogenase H-cluster maturation GTPase HydF [Oribacterium sp.]